MIVIDGMDSMRLAIWHSYRNSVASARGCAGGRLNPLDGCGILTI